MLFKFFTVYEEEKLKMYQYIAELRTIESWLQKRTSMVPFESPEIIKNVQNLPFISQEFSYSNTLPPSLNRLNFINLINAEVPEWG